MFRFLRLASRQSFGVQLFICVLFLAELAAFTWYRNFFGPYTSPVVLYGLGIALSISVLSFAKGKQLVLYPLTGDTDGSWWFDWRIRALALTTAAIAGGWYLTNQAKYFIRLMRPQDYSDIIPALHAYAGRWMNNTDVYAPMTWELGYFELASYLPAMWFPFVLPEWLGFDYRYMAWSIFLLGTAAYEVVVWRLKRPWPTTMFLSLLPLFSMYAMLTTTWGYIGITVEYMILGFYSLLVVGILLRSWPLQALGLLLCLLSRYSLVFWTPLFLLMLFFQYSRRQALLIAGTVLLGIVALYIVPYLSHNWGLFMEVQRSYTDAAVNEWKNINSDGEPLHLYFGLGLASFYYHYGHGSLYDKIGLLKTTHIGMLLLVVVVAGLAYYRLRSTIDYRIYAICILKLYLATFYAFIQVPYSYLFTLSIFMSAFLLLIALGVRPVADVPAATSRL